MQIGQLFQALEIDPNDSRKRTRFHPGRYRGSATTSGDAPRPPAQHVGVTITRARPHTIASGARESPRAYRALRLPRRRWPPTLARPHDGDHERCADACRCRATWRLLAGADDRDAAAIEGAGRATGPRSCTDNAPTPIAVRHGPDIRPRAAEDPSRNTPDPPHDSRRSARVLPHPASPIQARGHAEQILAAASPLNRVARPTA
jgi:hypothetical protein